MGYGARGTWVMGRGEHGLWGEGNMGYGARGTWVMGQGEHGSWGEGNMGPCDRSCDRLGDIPVSGP